MDVLPVNQKRLRKTEIYQMQSFVFEDIVIGEAQFLLIIDEDVVQFEVVVGVSRLMDYFEMVQEVEGQRQNAKFGCFQTL